MNLNFLKVLFLYIVLCILILLIERIRQARLMNSSNYNFWNVWVIRFHWCYYKLYFPYFYFFFLNIYSSNSMIKYSTQDILSHYAYSYRIQHNMVVYICRDASLFLKINLVGNDKFVFACDVYATLTHYHAIWKAFIYT